MEISNQDKSELKRLEQELWMEATRFDRPYMEKVMAQDFFEFGRSGRVYQREDTLTIERSTIDAKIPLQDLSIRLLSKDVAQVTYTSYVTYSGVTEVGRRSSIWSRTGDSSKEAWQLRFHQGTAVLDNGP